MARRPKPFPHQGWFKSNAGGTRVKLCRVEEGLAAAEVALARHLVAVADAAKHGADEVKRRPKPLAGVRLVADVHDEYLDSVQVDSAHETYRLAVKRLKPFFDRLGARPIASLTGADGVAYKRWLMEERHCEAAGETVSLGKLAAVTVNSHMALAKTLLNFAEARDYLTRNPWRRIKRLPCEGRSRVLLPHEWDALLAEETTQEWRDMLTVLRYTTMRPGELRNLDWGFVAWGAHQIVYPASVVKTRRRRAVTLVEPAEGTLRRRWVGAGEPASGLVFGSPVREGQPRELTAFSQHFRALVLRCQRKGKLERFKAGERLCMYTTRHSRITELHALGVPQHVIQKEAGHAHYSMTQRYEHLAETFVTEAVRRLATPPSTPPSP